jgi:hypothetical protein
MRELKSIFGLHAKAIRSTINHIQPEYKLFLFKSVIIVYDKNIILFIFESKLDEFDEDYFRTM